MSISTSTLRNSAIRQARAYVADVKAGKVPQQYPLRDNPDFKAYVQEHAGDAAKIKAAAERRLAVLAKARQTRERRKADARLQALAVEIERINSILSNPEAPTEQKAGLDELLSAKTIVFGRLHDDYLASYGVQSATVQAAAA